MAERVSTGLVSITVLGAGDAAIATNSVIALTLPTAKPCRAVIRTIHWMNRTGGDGNLLIGFRDRTVAGAWFRQVFPSIYMVNGIDDGMEEGELPIMGNTRQGFAVDTTPVTGTLGNIVVETDCIGVAAAPADVQVIMEVEII